MSVTTTTEGPIRIVTMDDGKANALSKSVIADLAAAISEADADDDIRAVVLAGREGRFSAGFDLSVMQSGVWADVVDLVADGGDLVRAIYGAGVPVVAAAHGHALAAGALLLLGCDVRIGADVEAKVGLNEVAIGMVLPDWAMTIAGDRLSKRHVQRSIVNARVTTPADAVDVGFLDLVVPADELMARAMTEAEALAALDPKAYRVSVERFRATTLSTMADQLAADRAAT